MKRHKSSPKLYTPNAELTLLPASCPEQISNSRPTKKHVAIAPVVNTHMENKANQLKTVPVSAVALLASLKS
jgi:hypothetical protein